jgi:hypothetical protein
MPFVTTHDSQEGAPTAIARTVGAMAQAVQRQRHLHNSRWRAAQRIAWTAPSHQAVRVIHDLGSSRLEAVAVDHEGEE